MKTTTNLELFANLTAPKAGHCGSLSDALCSAPSPLNDDQREVIRLLKERDTLTSADAVKIFGRSIYNNASDHIGRRLSRMVKRGLIVRIKPGVFGLPNAPSQQPRSNT